MSVCSSEVQVVQHSEEVDAQLRGTKDAELRVKEGAQLRSIGGPKS